MVKNFILFLVFCLTGNLLFAQYESGISYPDTTQSVVTDTSDISFVLANTITAEDLEHHLRIIASDEYEGRETGSPGSIKAANYIAGHFSELGINPTGIENTYFQNVAFNKSYWEDTQFEVADTSFRHLWDYIAFATSNTDVSVTTEDEIVFLGYGIDDDNYSDYKGNDLSGKIIMINKGEPLNKDSISYLTGTKELSDWSTSRSKKLQTAHEHGVKLVLIIEENLRKFLDQNRRFLVSPRLQLGDGNIDDKTIANHMYVSGGLARKIIGGHAKKIKKWRKKNTKKGKACDITLDTPVNITLDKKISVITGQNVMAYFEGTDKADELVVVSAHYDHLGKRGKDIFNGADDNGSGTSAVLEFAEALAFAKSKGYGPDRSILLLLVTGEEKGLLGSDYYAENPIYPLDQTIANVNVDMIGRVDEKHKDDPKYIYVIGSDRLSSDLHAINEDINNKYSQLTLDYQYNGEDDPNRYYYRSDHYNFAKKGIPAIFFFSGTHQDYHRPTDTVDKIMFEKMTLVARHIFHVIWDLANRKDAIEVDGAIE